MNWDIITSLALIFSIFIVWIQRKTIFDLERDVWEVEQAYKNKVGKPYQYKRRTFQLWGNNEGKQKEGEN